MTRLSHEQLLGYLLGALDGKECEEVEQALAHSPELTAEFERIRRSLDTLGLLEEPEPEEPPLCLAARTCEFVEQRIEAYAAETVTVKAITSDKIEILASADEALVSLEPANPPTAAARISSARNSGIHSKVKLSSVSRAEAGGTSFRRLDMVIAASIVVVISALSFPALFSSRLQVNVNVCQNNLRQLGGALHEYSELQPDGAFPHVPATGNRSFAGVYAPTLVSNGLVPSNKAFLCPGDDDAQSDARIMPTLQDVDSADSGMLSRFRNLMANSFGYNMGYARELDVLPPKNSRREHYALLGDAPSDAQPGRASANHNSRGQNMLYEDGRVKFVNLDGHAKSQSALDDPFHNRLGQVAAGIDIDDVVLGRNADRPMPVSFFQP
jgi:anti-sigma factor RsiW